MSFDLWVWKAPAYTLATINGGIARFEAGVEGAFEASPAVRAFYDELTARLPATPSRSGSGHRAATAWASPPAKSDRMIAMRLAWSVADEQLDTVLRLVDEHDLWLYDPQRALVEPPRSSRAAGARGATGSDGREGPRDAPGRDAGGAPGAASGAPRPNPRARREATGVPDEVRASDGTRLRLRHWPPAGDPWATLLILHGIAEHAGRYDRAATIWAAAGIDVHAFDLRGHGESGGRRVYVERWDDFLDDVEGVLGTIRVAGRPLVVFGHSMGALIALTYATSARPAPDMLVLSAPPLEANVPRWQRIAAPVLSRLAPTLVIANPIDGAQLSRDPAVAEAYFGDPLVQPRSTARLGNELLVSGPRALRELAELDVPTLVVHGSDDVLVPTRASEPLGRLPGVERRVLAGLRHETLNEPEGPELARAIAAWIRDRTMPPAGSGQDAAQR